jgi:hypothetical protein
MAVEQATGARGAQGMIQRLEKEYVTQHAAAQRATQAGYSMT